jgi:hypothetical protein
MLWETCFALFASFDSEQNIDEARIILSSGLPDWPALFPPYAQAVSIRQPHCGRNDPVRDGRCPCRASVSVDGKSPIRETTAQNSQYRAP